MTHAKVLLCVLCCLLTAPASPRAQEAAAPEASGPPTVAIPLDETLRFIIQPTILGLVPPRMPESFGEVFVRIVLPAQNVIIGHYEIKEEVPLAATGEAGTADGKVETRIRRGEFWAQGIEDSPAILPPLYWGNGELVTNSGLLWLSAASFDSLAVAGSCPIDLREPGYVASAASAELMAAVEQLAAAQGLAPDANFALELIEKAQYPCLVNGVRARIDALLARDSLGLAEYWILDDPHNPLIVKMTYTLGDAQQREDLSFIKKGGGYAVTSIDFTP